MSREKRVKVSFIKIPIKTGKGKAAGLPKTLVVQDRNVCPKECIGGPVREKTIGVNRRLFSLPPLVTLSGHTFLQSAG